MKLKQLGGDLHYFFIELELTNLQDCKFIALVNRIKLIY